MNRKKKKQKQNTLKVKEGPLQINNNCFLTRDVIELCRILVLITTPPEQTQQQQEVVNGMAISSKFSLIRPLQSQELV